MGKKIDLEIQKQIPILYKELGVKTKVAETLGISVSTVSKYLNLYEAAPQDENYGTVERKTRVKITEEMEEKINELYKQYKNMTKVAKELGISSSAVKNHLNEENKNLIKTQNEDRDALFYYIYRLFGQYSEDQPVSAWNITQMQKFKEKGMPYRGQLLTLKYFYEVKHNSIEKSRGSIGIIDYIWDEAAAYYQKQALRTEQITESIQKQLQQDRIEIQINPSDFFSRKRKKKTIDLNSLEE